MEKNKNPLAYLKHIVKDPIRTIAEADERKKEIMPLLYGSIGLTVVCLILQVVLDLSFLAIFSFIGIVGIALCAFLFFIIKKAKTKFAALTCDSCNTMFDEKTNEAFNKYVTYQLVSEKSNFNLSHPSSNNGIVSYIKATGSSDAVLSVSFVCPNCGKTKSFRYSITPFRCELEQKKVRVPDVELVKAKLENSVREVLAVYESSERGKIPYSIASIHHPNYENRTKPQVGYEKYNGVSIIYHREIDEMVEGLFIHNELNGNITLNK